jgi:hypothetical protein
VNTTYLANIVICFHCVETSTKSNHSLIMFAFFETRSSHNHSHVPTWLVHCSISDLLLLKERLHSITVTFTT